MINPNTVEHSTWSSQWFGVDTLCFQNSSIRADVSLHINQSEHSTRTETASQINHAQRILCPTRRPLVARAWAALNIQVWVWYSHFWELKTPQTATFAGLHMSKVGYTRVYPRVEFHWTNHTSVLGSQGYKRSQVPHAGLNWFVSRL